MPNCEKYSRSSSTVDEVGTPPTNTFLVFVTICGRSGSDESASRAEAEACAEAEAEVAELGASSEGTEPCVCMPSPRPTAESEPIARPDR